MPATGSVEVVSMPTADGTPLTITGTVEGDCAFDLEISMVLPPESFGG